MAYADDHPSPANTIALAPHRDKWIIQELPLKAAASPGHMVEKTLDTVKKIQKSSAEDDQVSMMVLLDDPDNNKTWTDAYAAGDVAPFGWLQVGFQFTARIASTEDISDLDKLEITSGGQLKEAAATTSAANTARFTATEDDSKGTADGSEVLIRVERFC